MLNGFGWPHLLIIAVLIVVLFGAKRLPDAARGLGKSMRIFRAETRGMHEDEEAASGSPTQAPPQQLSAPQPPTTTPSTEQTRTHDQPH